MTRGEVRAAVQRNLGRSGVTSTEDSDVDRWINQTIREDICADHNWAGMEQLRTRTTTAGTGEYAFQNATTFKDADWLAILKSASDEYVRLDEVSEDVAYREFGELSTARGFPMVWARTANSYLLRPIPDASTYTIREKVWEYPPEIATGSGSDSSTNFVTLYWTKLLEYGCTARGLRHYGEYEKALVWEQLYRDELGKAVSVDRKRLAPSKITLKPSIHAGKPAPGFRGTSRRIKTGDLSWYP